LGVLEWSSDDTDTIRDYLERPEREAAEVGLPTTILAEDPYVTEIKAIAADLMDLEPFEVTPQEAREALRLALAVDASVRTGLPVRPSEVH
jgi:dihydroorotase-like cyclic amidohydrolase